jgi:hypothetical protein
MTWAQVSSLVLNPRMTSTNFMMGTGFMKCIPMTCEGRFVAAAIFVMEIEDVFDARMQWAGAAASSCSNIFSFKSVRSVAASITNSALAAPVAISVDVDMRPSVAFFS